VLFELNPINQSEEQIMTFHRSTSDVSGGVDSLEEFFLSWGGQEEGVEATTGIFCSSSDWQTLSKKSLPGTTATDPTHLASSSAGSPQSQSHSQSHHHDEFGFQLFPSCTNGTPFTPGTIEEPKEPQVIEQVIDCTKSTAGCSVSTMTRTAFPSDKPSHSPALSPQPYRPAASQPIPKGTRKRSSPVGIQKALSKLALCGHSAKEDALDLEYVVLSLRQAITATEATASLRHMVQVLKQQGRADQRKSRSTSDIQEGFVAAGADHCVISTLWNFPSSVPVQYYGVIAMGELVAHSHLPNQKSIVLKGGVEVVLTAMKNHPEEETLQEEACRTLKNVMKYFDMAKQHVARHNGISRILQAMMTHPEYASVQRQACYALTSLSCLKAISDELVTNQGHAVLLKTMQHHNDDCFVLAESWRTLTNIVIHSMNTSLDEEIATYGMDLICQSLQRFANCTQVPIQTRGLTLLTHLCYRSPTNLERLTRTHNLEIIHMVLRQWKHDEKVQAAGEKLVLQISQAGYSLPRQPQQPHASGRYSNRIKRPPATAVISQIQNERGLDIIVDTTMY
jgi:hypothetical protein